VIFLICPKSLASSYSEATRKASQAFYIQSGWNKAVNDAANRLERRYLAQPVKDIGGWLFLIQKVVAEQQITYKWTW